MLSRCVGLVFFCALVFLAPFPLHAQWAEQTLHLAEGHNAIHMHVTPVDEIDDLFESFPAIKQIQSFNATLSRQFADSPAMPLPRGAEWLYWARPGESALPNTLTRLYAGDGYIFEASEAVTVVITGRVSVLTQRWRNHEYHLTGFEVASATGPTFDQFFGNAQSAVDYVRRLPPLSLNNWSQWQDVNWNQPIVGGQAYFVKTKAPIDYIGLFKVEGSLIFDAADRLSSMSIHNNSATSSLSIFLDPSLPAPPGQRPLAGPVPLLYWTQAGEFEPLPDTGFPITLEPDEVRRLFFRIDRSQLAPRSDTNAVFASILRVQNESGSVVMRRPVFYDGDGEADERAGWPFGLWVGNATISSVDFVHGSNVVEAATADHFNIRLIVHHDTNDVTRLLSRVICVLTTNEAGAAFYKVYTDERDVPPEATDNLFRISSAAFGMMPPMTLSGTFLQNSCTGSTTIAANDPMNPYVHVHHRDLTNAFEIVNTVTFSWTSSLPALITSSPLRPDGMSWGDFEQTVSGLRTQDITAKGLFRLEWISGTATLVE